MLQFALNQLVGTAPFSAGSKIIVFQETQQFFYFFPSRNAQASFWHFLPSFSSSSVMHSVQPRSVKDWGGELWSTCRFPHPVCIQMRCMIHAGIKRDSLTRQMELRAEVLNSFMYASEKEPAGNISNRKIDEGD